MGTSKIDYVTHGWSVVTGCTPYSSGCEHCYAQRMATRYGWDFTPTMHPERMAEHRAARKPRVVFVAPLGDLFHEAIPTGFVRQVIEEAQEQFHHTFLFLTKRAEQMVAVLRDCEPAPNLWMGVTVESAEYTNRFGALHVLKSEGWNTWASLEPLLGPVNIETALPHLEQQPTMMQVSMDMAMDAGDRNMAGTWVQWDTTEVVVPGLDFVAVGGESGVGAREVKAAWISSVVVDCEGANVPVFVKQMWEGWPGGLKNMPPLLKVQQTPWVLDKR